MLASERSKIDKTLNKSSLNCTLWGFGVEVMSGLALGV